MKKHINVKAGAVNVINVKVVPKKNVEKLTNNAASIDAAAIGSSILCSGKQMLKRALINKINNLLLINYGPCNVLIMQALLINT